MGLTPKKTFEMNDVEWHDLINSIYRMGRAAGQLEQLAIKAKRWTSPKADTIAAEYTTEAAEIDALRDRIVDAIDTKDASLVIASLQNASSVIEGAGNGCAEDVPFWLLTPTTMNQIPYHEAPNPGE